ncbi:MAG TPA: glycosyltransferase N-terminal domain-containing protein [Gemmatimonadales bacterium]|nr:glycosyltransferase N-terminal domain-containing protein [Gemmatimonadales bacterium]
MLHTSLAYRGGVRLATALLPVAARLSPKLGQAHRARRGVLERLETWARAHRDAARPLAWFHAPSVGEGLQAEAVMQALRTARPGWQLAYTHFSSSAEALARRVPADIADYLPYDTPEAAEALLDILRPTALVFTKLDLWPELATRAALRGVKVVLVAATVRPGSGRLGWPARSLLAPGYEALSAVAAIDPADAVRVSALGARPAVIEVEGDPRYDSVAAKVAAVDRGDPLLRFGGGAPTLVAGSTWPDDEAILLEAFARVRAEHPQAQLIVVPHEPTPHHLSRLDDLAARLRLPVPVRLSAATGPTPLLAVDRVGVLAALYGAGTMAYVGGGYRKAGLHSVLEPAAWGIPVLMGPRWTESRDAALLREAGAAVGLPERYGPEDPMLALVRAWSGWITNEAARREAGRKGRAVVDAGLGASARCAAVVVKAVEG